jgi:RNA polymerase sigma factor (sigma-70 family)
LQVYKPIGSQLFKKISDKSLIEGIRNQDDKTLNWLYENYFTTVRDYIIKNSGTAEDVSDTFQDAIIVLYNRVISDSFTLTSDLKGYFFGIVKNIWSNHLKLRKNTVEIDADFLEDHSFEEVTEVFLGRIIEKAMSKMNPESREVLQMFYDGHSYDEIAKKLKYKNETYARRKKYLCKEELLELVKEDPEYQEYLRFNR